MILAVMISAVLIIAALRVPLDNDLKRISKYNDRIKEDLKRSQRNDHR